MSARRLGALALLLAGLPGCLYVGARGSLGPRLDPEVVARIVPGTTTRSQVLELLGPPNEFKRPELTTALLDDGVRLSGVLDQARRAEDVFTWQFDRVALDGTVLILFNGFAVETTTELLVVFFDGAGIVRQVAFAPAGAP